MAQPTLNGCGTKAKLRNIMSAIFKHAMRHEWADKNPISLVRQSAKQEVIPAVLDLTEISALRSTLEHPFRQMVFLAAATGLRASELLALQWGDIRFDSLEICLGRGVVHQVIGDLTWLNRFLRGGAYRYSIEKPTGFLQVQTRKAALLARELIASAHPARSEAMRH